MRFFGMETARWFASVRSPGGAVGRRRARRPGVEAVEGRLLLSVAVPHAHTPHPKSSPLAPYRIFEGTITSGPAAGLSLKGPLVLGYSGRTQVIGYLFTQGGGRDLVFGTDFGGEVALQIQVPTRAGIEVVEAVGSGQLQGVRGGLPDGQSLIGFGNLNGPDLKRDFGKWATYAPSKAP